MILSIAQQYQSHSIPQTVILVLLDTFRRVPKTDDKCKSIKESPESYTNVPPVSLPANDQMKIPWFDKVTTALANETEPDLVDMNVSWSAHFANSQVSVPKSPAIISLLPLFRDGAHSPAMVKHGMNIIQHITVRVNPGQIPVFTVDQPIYAIAKKIQWTWRYVILMGGLHIEMAMLKLIGDWLDGSRWTYVMTSANVTTEGCAVCLQKGSHTSRGQWAHQVTAAALFIILHRSYADYQLNTPDDRATTL